MCLIPAYPSQRLYHVVAYAQLMCIFTRSLASMSLPPTYLYAPWHSVISKHKGFTAPPPSLFQKLSSSLSYIWEWNSILLRRLARAIKRAIADTGEFFPGGKRLINFADSLSAKTKESPSKVTSQELGQKPTVIFSSSSSPVQPVTQYRQTAMHVSLEYLVPYHLFWCFRQLQGSPTTSSHSNEKE